MARTEDEIRDAVRSNTPGWFWEPGEVAEAIIRGLCALGALREEAQQTLHDRTFIATADGAWLDEHGRERSTPRRPLEPDDAYRDRIRAYADLVTPKSIRDAVNRELDVGECRLEEYLIDGFFADQDFAEQAHVFDQDRGFAVYIPVQVDALSDSYTGATTLIESPALNFREFAGGDSAAGFGEIFAEPDGPAFGPVYPKVIDAIERTRAAGVAYRVEIEEPA